jgi:hypothetical protein
VYLEDGCLDSWQNQIIANMNPLDPLVSHVIVDCARGWFSFGACLTPVFSCDGAVPRVLKTSSTLRPSPHPHHSSSSSLYIYIYIYTHSSVHHPDNVFCLFCTSLLYMPPPPFILFAFSPSSVPRFVYTRNLLPTSESRCDGSVSAALPLLLQSLDAMVPLLHSRAIPLRRHGALQFREPDKQSAREGVHNGLRLL